MAFRYPFGCTQTKHTHSLWFNLKGSMVWGICLLLTVTRLLASGVSRWAKLVISKRMFRMEANKIVRSSWSLPAPTPSICQRGCHHLLVPIYMVKENTLSTAMKDETEICALQATVSVHCSATHLCPVHSWSSDKVLKLWASISEIRQCHELKLWRTPISELNLAMPFVWNSELPFNFWN